MFWYSFGVRNTWRSLGVHLGPKHKSIRRAARIELFENARKLSKQHKQILSTRAHKNYLLLYFMSRWTVDREKDLDASEVQ